jgi:hypothetical protein
MKKEPLLIDSYSEYSYLGSELGKKNFRFKEKKIDKER